MNLLHCSNIGCSYEDDSNADFTPNYKAFLKEQKKIRKDGEIGMELTEQNFIFASEKINSESNEKDCSSCHKGKMEIANVFAKKQYGDLLYNYLSKCSRCHKTSFSFQLSKNDPFVKGLFG
jgi:hypothetical protein